jgi:hypothetical protein
LLLLLSSDKSGEVVAAAHAIERALHAVGSDWHDLAAQLTGPSPPSPSPSPRHHDHRRRTLVMMTVAKDGGSCMLSVGSMRISYARASVNSSRTSTIGAASSPRGNPTG